MADDFWSQAYKPKETPEVDEAETLINSSGDAVPLMRPAINILSTLGLQAGKALGLGKSQDILTDKAKGELRARGLAAPEVKDSIPGFLDTYRQVRDERRGRIEAGAEQNPWSHRIGTGLGLLTSLAAPTVTLRGAGALQRLGGAALTGAAYGGLHGATHGRADLTRGELGQFANDVVGVDGLRAANQSLNRGEYLNAGLHALGSGAAGGFGGGLAIGGAVEGARLGVPALRRYAVRKGHDVINGRSDIAAATRQPLTDEAVIEVLDSDLMGGTTAQTYANIERAAGDEGANYARILENLEANGVRGPEAQALADRLMDRFREEWVRAPNSKMVPDAFRDEANNILQITGPAPGAQGPVHPRLGLSQTEGLKQNLQRQARFERLTNNPVEEARQEISSMVRQANEESIADAVARAAPNSIVAREGAAFVPTKQRLGRLLEARTAAERGAVKAQARSSAPGLIDHVVGSTTGNPATSYLTALAVNNLRSRMPSILSRYGYGAANALERGGVGPGAARLTPLLGEPPTEEERRAALIEALSR